MGETMSIGLRHGTRGVIALGLLALLLAPPLSAQSVRMPSGAGQPVVASLDLRIVDAAVTLPEADYLSDLVRGAVPPHRFTVMTKENLHSLLSPAELESLYDCGSDICEVEVGRRVGADYVLSGEILRFGTELRILLKLHATDTARLLGTQSVGGIGVTDLELPVMDRTRQLFVDASLIGKAAPAPLLATRPEGGRGVEITLLSDPPGASVLLGGEKICERTPCITELPPDDYTLVLRKHNYYPQQVDVQVAPGVDSVLVTLSPRLGSIIVSAMDGRGRSYSGRVFIDGRWVGNTDEEIEVMIGQHELVVRAEDMDYRGRIVVNEGNPLRLPVRLRGGASPEQEQAEKLRENAAWFRSAVPGYSATPNPGRLSFDFSYLKVESKSFFGAGRQEISFQDSLPSAWRPAGWQASAAQPKLTYEKLDILVELALGSALGAYAVVPYYLDQRLELDPEQGNTEILRGLKEVGDVTAGGWLALDLASLARLKLTGGYTFATGTPLWELPDDVTFETGQGYESVPLRLGVDFRFSSHFLVSSQYERTLNREFVLVDPEGTQSVYSAGDETRLSARGMLLMGRVLALGCSYEAYRTQPYTIDGEAIRGSEASYEALIPQFGLKLATGPSFVSVYADYKLLLDGKNVLNSQALRIGSRIFF
jgi:hypothetical protein